MKTGFRDIPVHISSQCVDFSVVAEHAHRLGPVPARESVGRESRVYNTHKTGESVVTDICVVVVRELVGLQLSLVHNSFR